VSAVVANWVFPDGMWGAAGDQAARSMDSLQFGGVGVWTTCQEGVENISTECVGIPAERV
jgi:hypothetical protein